MNKTGVYLQDLTHVQHIFESPPHAIKAAERFFEANPGKAVADLIPIFDSIIESVASQPASTEGFNERFYRERSKNLSFKLINLEKLAGECGIEFSNVHYLSREQLFGKENIGD